MVVADCGLEEVTDHFMPSRRYIGDGRWTWRMRREDPKMTGRGDYILGTIRNFFSNAGVR